MKKQFVSELELISQLSVPNAVIGPISLCFLQLASLIHCGEKRGERERRAESEECRVERREMGGGVQRVHYMSVGACGVLVNLPPGGKNHLCWGLRQ